jgi:hypothetical protein
VAEKLVSDLLAYLVAAASNAGLYGPEHPAVKAYSLRAHAVLAELLKDSQELSLTAVGPSLLVGDTPLREHGAHVVSFLKKLRQRGLERVVFRQGVQPQEVEAFAVGLSGTKGAVPTGGHIAVGALQVRTRAPEGQVQGLLKQGQAMVAQVYHGLSRLKRLDAAGLEDAVLGFISALQREANVLRLLSPVKSHSEYTYVHITNVAVLSLFQAQALGLQGEALHEVGLAGLLHDVGKLFIPREVIEKEGKLQEAEWAAMQLHPLYGALFLSQQPDVPRVAAIVAFEHHMRYDGQGYPRTKLRSHRQHLVSQMVALADFFDALRSVRSYRGALDVPTIAGFIQEGAGSMFNPLLVKSFLQALKKAGVL